MKLSRTEIFSLFVSAVYLIAAEIQIRFSSSEKIFKAFQNSGARPLFFLKPLHQLRTTRVISLLEAVDRRLGWKPSCLRRTLALTHLSRGLGFAPEFKIGVRREKGTMRAHSWLELDGMRLEMDDEAAGYAALSPVSK